MYLLYFLAWIIFNGKVTTEIVIFGIVIAAAVFAFTCKFMGYSLKKEKMLYRKSFLILRYIGVLMVEIIKANADVVKFIFNDKEVVEPVIVTFQTNLKSELSRVILANSITLTPGTITISLEGDELVVHCLDKSLAEGLKGSVFEQKLKVMEEEE